MPPNDAKQKEMLGPELGKEMERKRQEDVGTQKAAESIAKKDLAAKKLVKIVLKNTLGEEVPQSDYFYAKVKGEDTTPTYFEEVCGRPVDREDMLVIFHKIFKPETGMLFYKVKDKEVYIVIVPLKHASVVGDEHNSIDGEFQKHAISFISEGSVNLDTLRTKLTRVSSTIKIAE